jgi:N-methylhydantoinase A/oxoprolinase/acetone carboxylase beta subunit
MLTRTISYFTQNNGTLISASEAKRLPILTYLSGPINSLTGAAFLSKTHGPFQKDVIVVDVGGTTTDTCVLQPTGLPRPAAAFSLISGARTNFSVPDLRSVGLGGGSLVHVDKKTGNVTVGPDSVGYQLETRSQIFGGPDLTVTDVISVKGFSTIGKYTTKAELESVKVPADLANQVERVIAGLLETVIDETKTEAGAVDIILVGGGTFLVPPAIQGVGQIYRPNYGHVANAVGAAMARVSHKIDRIVSLEGGSTEEQELSQQCHRTIEEAQAKGVLNPQIVEKTTMALSYSSTREVRMVTTAVGDAPLNKPREENTDNDAELSSQKSRHELDQHSNGSKQPAIIITDPTRDARAYRPSVSLGRWKLSETDLYFLSEGCGILGCGGGGDPYPSFLSALSLLRAGESVYVIDPTSTPANGAVPAVGFMGSPNILSERFPSGQE